MSKNDTSHFPLGSFGADRRTTEPVPHYHDDVLLWRWVKFAPYFAFPAESDGAGDFVIGSGRVATVYSTLSTPYTFTSKLRRRSGYESLQIQRTKLAGAGHNLALCWSVAFENVVPTSLTPNQPQAWHLHNEGGSY